MDKVIFRDIDSLMTSRKIYYNKNYYLLPDIAYSFSNKAFVNSKNNTKKIGVNFATHHFNDNIDSARIIIRELLDLDCEIVIINVQNNKHSQEWMIQERIREEFTQVKQIKYNSNIAIFFQDLGDMNLVIGSKLHLIISAHILGIPCVSLAYQEKVKSRTNQFISDEYQYSFDHCPTDIVLKAKEILLKNNYKYKMDASSFKKELSLRFREVISS